MITEPVMFNAGCVQPDSGYLSLLCDHTRKHDALLIFDKVITGFRFAGAGAQEYYGIYPDLTTMAKGLGGGSRCRRSAGAREVMSMTAEGRCWHSGT